MLRGWDNILITDAATTTTHAVLTITTHAVIFHTLVSYKMLRYIHLPDSQYRCSRGHRPSLAESVLSSTYWGRKDDLDIEYS